MPDLQKKSTRSGYLWGIYGLAIVMLGVIWYYHWIFGLVFSLLFTMSLFYTVQTERKILDDTEKYISTLSYRVHKTGEETIKEMPIGIILFNEDYKIEWSNPYMLQFFSEDNIVGKSLDDISEQLIPAVNENKQKVTFTLNDRQFKGIIKKEQRLLYILDRTEQSKVQTLYENDQTILAIIYLDNYDELTRNMDDTVKSRLNSKVTSVINHWSQTYGLYLKRTSQERFLAVGTNKILEQLEETKFNILDTVRELNTEQSIPLTISIGIGYGNTSLPELGELAQASLNLALGRGGDQVAIKDHSGKVRFYGGKTNPMEKRTRVRARVISHALTGLVEASENVFIMGHQAPDMDSLGAAIGIMHIAQTNGVNGYIIINPDDISTGVNRLIQSIKKDEQLWQHFIKPEKAHDMITPNSLVVVVDTHKPTMVVDQSLLHKANNTVVIDHHRRGEDFIENPTLVYMEPYASSTAELVTELLEYQPKDRKLSMLEASALLAGIVVDTKSFTLRTGSRTFAAASYLRANGADTVLVQKFLKEDFESYIKRSKLIKYAEIYRENIAIAKASPDEVFDSVLIAQTADTLLTMSGVNASFVISKRVDGRVGISARSLGKINVQLIMEQMGGGGHLTNAATQIKDITVHDAVQLLKQNIDKYFEGRDE